MSESPTSPRARDRAARAVITRALARIDGIETVTATGPAPLPSARKSGAEASTSHVIAVHDQRAWSAVLREGSAGLGEAWFRGWWHTDDLVGLLRHLIRNLDAVDRWQQRSHEVTRPILDPIRRLRRADPERDRRNVRAHYDLGNAFFATFLDETMTYSSGVFTAPDSTMADASREKLDRLCRKLGVDATSRVVEIGSGWGSFAMHAASEHGAHVTTTTISAAQAALARTRIDAAGLDDRVTLLEADYRHLEGSFDRLVSIEMIEAVDWRDVPSFFGHCARLLRDDGLMGLQAIVIADQRQDRAKVTTDYIKRWVFPGGSLPSITSIATAATSASDLRIVDVEDLGLHYAETLHRWRDALHASWSDLGAIGVDDDLARRWDFYLAYCEAAFLERHVSVVQMVLARSGWRPSTLGVRAD